MFEDQLMAAIHDWAYDDDASLLAALRERFAVLLAGARAVSPDALAPGGRARRARGGRRPAPAPGKSDGE
jgi:hypothetical protein